MYHLRIARMHDRTRKLDMPKVSRTVSYSVSTGLAALAGVNDSESGVHDAAAYRISIFVVSISNHNLGNRHLSDVIWAEKPELNRVDFLCSKTTHGHLDHLLESQPTGKSKRHHFLY